VSGGQRPSAVLIDVYTDAKVDSAEVSDKGVKVVVSAKGK
jgi:hypothetical protein